MAIINWEENIILLFVSPCTFYLRCRPQSYPGQIVSAPVMPWEQRHFTKFYLKKETIWVGGGLEAEGKADGLRWYVGEVPNLDCMYVISLMTRFSPPTLSSHLCDVLWTLQPVFEPDRCLYCKFQSRGNADEEEMVGALVLPYRTLKSALQLVGCPDSWF